MYGDVKVKGGRICEYLGLDLDYKTPGLLTLSMTPHITKIIEEFLEEINGTATTQDPQTAMMLLTIRVISTDEDDWGKIK